MFSVALGRRALRFSAPQLFLCVFPAGAVFGRGPAARAPAPPLAGAAAPRRPPLLASSFPSSLRAGRRPRLVPAGGWCPRQIETGGSPAPRAPPAWSAVAVLAPWAVLRFTRRPIIRPSSAGGRAPAPAACGGRGWRVPLHRVGSLLIARVFVGGLCVGSPPAAGSASRPLVGFGLRPCRRRRRRPPCGRAPPLRFGAG